MGWTKAITSFSNYFCTDRSPNHIMLEYSILLESLCNISKDFLQEVTKSLSTSHCSIRLRLWILIKQVRTREEGSHHQQHHKQNQCATQSSVQPKTHKYPAMEKFTLFIMASNSLSTSRSRRGESLCSNSSVSPCCSCDTKMLSPLPPPSLCLAHNSKQQLLNVSAKTEMLSVKGRQQFSRDLFYPAKDL